MKRLLPILLILLLLVSCGKTPETPEPVSVPSGPAAPAPSPEPVPATPDKPDDPEPAPQPAKTKELTDAYIAAMDDYEDLEIAVLGVINQFQTLEQVLDRAVKTGKFPFLSEITESEMIFGDLSTTENYVYLIIPAANTDLTVGRYSWYAGEITQKWYSLANSRPILYIETADNSMRAGMIEYVRHLSMGVSQGNMFTGLSVADSKLRTAYLMGIVDVTPYEIFDSTEIPFYQQSFFDTLCEVAEVKDGLAKGANLSLMDEFVYEGVPYALYVLSGTTDTFFAIRYDTYTGTRTILMSTDFQTWTQTGMG